MQLPHIPAGYGVGATFAGIALVAALGVSAHADTEPAPLPPCAYEDGSGGPVPCYWDGSSMGNGIGDSYIVHEVDGDHTPINTPDAVSIEVVPQSIPLPSRVSAGR